MPIPDDPRIRERELQLGAIAEEILAKEHGLWNYETDEREMSGEFGISPEQFGPWFDASRAINMALIDRAWRRMEAYGGASEPWHENRQTLLDQSIRVVDPDGAPATRGDFVERGEVYLARAEETMGLTGSGAAQRRAAILTRMKEAEMGLLGSIAKAAKGASDIAVALAPGIEAGVEAAAAITGAITPVQQAAFPLVAAGPLAVTPYVAPGGALTLPQASALTVGAIGAQQAGLLGELGEVLLPKGLEPYLGLGGDVSSDAFIPTGGRYRPSTTIEMQNPLTGKTHYWRHLGRPVLWSSDYAACKRVKKVASKARSRRPR